MSVDQIVFLCILVIATLLFMTEKIRIDLTAMLVIAALAITGLLDAKAAFSGFSSEPALIVAAVFILSAGLSKTGVTDVIGNWAGRWAGQSEWRAVLVIMTVVATLSAFTHHLMVTALMLPIVMKICSDKGLHSSRLLIPMATSASLGTTLTLIGAPAFLLANNILVRSGQPSLGLFTVGQVGLPLVVASFALILLLRWVLPQRSGADNSSERFQVNEFFTELIIPEGSRWIGKTMDDLVEETKERFLVRSWYRDHQIQLMRQPQQILKQGDVLLVKTSSDELVSVQEKLGLAIRAVKRYGETLEDTTGSLDESKHLVLQAVIAPRSPFIGRTLAELKFFERYGVAVVALWRKTGWVFQEISTVRLEQGDLVLLWGSDGSFEPLLEDRGFLMLLPFQGKAKRRIKMQTSTAIMGLSVAAAAMGWLEPYIAFVTGATLMVLTNCLSAEEAYESVETKIYVLIAGVIPLGIAMEKTGVDKLIADFLFTHIGTLAPLYVMLIFFWISALLTQVLSDAATTVLLAPIGLAYAKAAHISPTAVVVVITIGAVASFLTPIGHHGNLLILSPGGYRFSDYLRIGLPLTVLISVITCLLSLRVWH